MKRSLYWRLTLAFILVAFITALLVAALIRFTSVNRLSQLVVDQQRSTVEQILKNYYTNYGSWAGIEQYWQQIQVAAEERNNIRAGGGDIRVGRDRRNLFGLADAQGKVIIGLAPDYPVGTNLTKRVLRTGTSIEVNGKTVGTILTPHQSLPFNPAEALFLERTNQALVLAMLGAMVVALFVGVALSSTLTRPIRALTNAAQAIASGKLEQEVKVNSNDEIGQLAAAFNSMSQEVSRVNQMRRQMTADIAHDLRTPLTVIGGYIESMRDGVLQPTPERLSLIYSEIERLQKMVGDLRILSQADAGELPLNPQKVSPKALLDQAAGIFQHHAELQNVHLSVQTSDPLPDILVDEARMMQVMDNLISNALRYTPPGGEIILGAKTIENQVEMTVQDTGTGIAEEDLPQIFDRFHRADKSRHSETGESGLGLAIVKALVEAHHGQIWAESRPGMGTAIHIVFPVA